jgi:endonuclease/exonuclease/phosphatase (EEP) superfamily protein YafD
MPRGTFVVMARRSAEILLPILKWLGAGVASVVMLVLLVRLAAGTPLVRDGSFLDGVDYLPPWSLVALVLPSALLSCALRQWRLALALGGTFLALLIFQDDVSWPRSASPVPGAPVLKVVTLNVQYYRHGREFVADAVKSMDKDVALLSENDVPPADVPKLQALFAPLHFYSGRPQETAIVSRMPLRDVKEVELPSFQASLRRPNRLDVQSSHPHRSFLHAQLDLNGSIVHLISVRFIAGRPPSTRPADQLAWGRYLVKTHHDEGRFFVDYVSRLQGPVIFGGDLNAPPTSKLIRRLGDVAQDAYLATHWWGRPTYEVGRPLLRLDYLFGMNGAVALEATVLPQSPADHYPVWARFALPVSASNAAVRGTGR